MQVYPQVVKNVGTTQIKIIGFGNFDNNPILIDPQQTLDLFTVTDAYTIARSWHIEHLVAIGLLQVITPFDLMDADPESVSAALSVANRALAGSNGLNSATGTITVSGSAAPSTGQVLVATSPTTAEWQTSSTSGITELTGDVVASGAGSVVASVVQLTDVSGPTSLDDGFITTDGAGTLTAVSFQGDGSQLTGIASVPAGLTGAIQFNSSNTFEGDTSNLFWDNINKRLGVGTDTPAFSLDVIGDARITGNFTVADGTVSFDNDFIKTDGSGNLTAVAFYGDGSHLTGLDGPNFVDLETPSGVIDGVNTLFTISHTPISTVYLWWNGILMNPNGNDFAVSENTLTTTFVPRVGDVLLVSFRW